MTSIFATTLSPLRVCQRGFLLAPPAATFGLRLGGGAMEMTDPHHSSISLASISDAHAAWPDSRRRPIVDARDATAPPDWGRVG